MKTKPKPLQLSDFKKGFRYQAFIGYKWEDVQYPETGFTGEQLPDAINKKLVRPAPPVSEQKNLFK